MTQKKIGKNDQHLPFGVSRTHNHIGHVLVGR